MKKFIRFAHSLVSVEDFQGFVTVQTDDCIRIQLRIKGVFGVLIYEEWKTQEEAIERINALEYSLMQYQEEDHYSRFIKFGNIVIAKSAIRNFECSLDVDSIEIERFSVKNIVGGFVIKCYLFDDGPALACETFNEKDKADARMNELEELLNE